MTKKLIAIDGQGVITIAGINHSDNIQRYIKLQEL